MTIAEPLMDRVRALATIDYVPEAFSMQNQTPMGRQAAGEGFLRAYLKHSGGDDFGALVRSAADGASFEQVVRQLAPSARAHWMNTRDVSGLEQAGTLFCYHPSLTEHAWRRRYFGAARYSICGLTHTLSSDRAMRAVTELVSAPFHAWDALICPSRAIRDVTLRLIEQQQAFAVERYGARALDLPQLPVIPLAVAANDFDGLDGLRNKARQKLGIDRHDVACVYVGRLSMHAKANPAPMLIALERAAAHVPHGGKMAMLFVGWFANDHQQAAFRQAAARLAPSVRVSFVDGRKANLRREAWAAADIFYQLADNVQESFGLAPVEGMAAGLPVVVSDWDGFRDSVVDGETGFLIPTTQPLPGHAGDIARFYAEGWINYDAYIGSVSQFTSADIDAAAKALSTLAADPALRARMGAAGKARVKALYDWPVVIRAYQDLWAELAEIRAKAPPALMRHQSPDPAASDPFTIFAGFATRHLTPNTWVAPGTDAGVTLDATRLVENLLPPAELIARIGAIMNGQKVQIGALMTAIPDVPPPILLRHAAWLIKVGYLNVVE